MPADYNNTLQLPKTDFPMRANLPSREQELFKKQAKERLYYRIIEKNKGKKDYILHDGPPYANADIHLGTALNKILKDFVVKEKNMSGYHAPYIPGWDTHGLPIELKALKSSDVHKDTITPIELREICRKYALSYVENQKKQFLKLGVIGDYEDPYLTLKPEYEAMQIRIFGEMAKKGYIYKGLKPVYWCADCGTALAEAEIEYEEDPCDSIFVKFAVSDDKDFFAKHKIEKEKVRFLIWTTTTWTLPGNLAVCLGPSYSYALVKTGEEYLIIAEDLVDSVMEAGGIKDYEICGSYPGSDFEYMKVKHPFLDRESLVILGEHVTLESGTGCVHTAPGHGVEDFEVSVRYHLPIVVPVDANGVLTEEAGEFAGLSTDDANRVIAKKLTEIGCLFAVKKIQHPYPHCWRCKHPIIFRATQQWFCSIEGFKKEALKAIEGVNWIPSWGLQRMKNMVEDRSDWCISRQRIWGVPIPIVYCEDCGEALINEETIEAIAQLFEKEGSNAWYQKDPKEFLPPSVRCQCGSKAFRKETDIMDVWFDSGVSYAAVASEREDFHLPVDLYLEGADQHRGWFQSSLLTSVACRGVAPYKTVCTHGWVVDGEGKKMSKSLKNGVAPEKIIEQYGADILRLWIASSDYHADIRISPEILKQLTEIYRKIRNTARFILGNICDFDPKKNAVSPDDFCDLDRWALLRLNELIAQVKKGYDSFEFYTIFHAVHHFCVVDLSNFYLDILKDRLYCDEKAGQSRRSAQTAIYWILHALCRLIAPILAFTSEEIWSYLPREDGDVPESVLLNPMPEPIAVSAKDGFMDRYARILRLRESAQKALEEKRAAKEIRSSLEARLVFYCDSDWDAFLSDYQKELPELLRVSEVTLKKQGTGCYPCEDGISVDVFYADGEKCERCWNYSSSVGQHEDHPTICDRCYRVVTHLKEGNE